MSNQPFCGDCNLLQVPCDLLQQIAFFLSPTDAKSLCLVCQNLHASLSLATLPPRVIISAQHQAGHLVDGDRPEEFFTIPIVHHRIHTIRLSFKWNDQGWGNQKGQLWIIGRREGQRDKTRDFDGGRVVYESPLAPRTLAPLKTSFTPVDGEVYHLWRKVGRGGGHILFLHEGSISELICDDPSVAFAKVYKSLWSNGVIAKRYNQEMAVPDFYSNLFLATCDMMRVQLANGQQPEKSLLSFFESNGININVKALDAIKEIMERDKTIRARLVAEKEERAGRQTRRPEGRPGPFPNFLLQLGRHQMDIPVGLNDDQPEENDHPEADIVLEAVDDDEAPDDDFANLPQGIFLGGVPIPIPLQQQEQPGNENMFELPAPEVRVFVGREQEQQEANQRPEVQPFLALAQALSRQVEEHFRQHGPQPEQGRHERQAPVDAHVQHGDVAQEIPAPGQQPQNENEPQVQVIIGQHVLPEDNNVAEGQEGRQEQRGQRRVFDVGPGEGLHNSIRALVQLNQRMFQNQARLRPGQGVANVQFHVHAAAFPLNNTDQRNPEPDADRDAVME